MRYFAVLDENNIVVNAYSVDDSISYEEDEIPPETVFENDPECMEYSLDSSITNNQALIGYAYDDSLNAFIPPCPDNTYILDTQTFEWYPNTELDYDLHGDGNLYRYSPSKNGWILSQTPLDTRTQTPYNMGVINETPQ